jgi:predicted house-cleaning noncanonical NTP pyrophosphatase (MazG superfamily)
MLRDFIGDNIRIDGRMIEYKLVTASDYLEYKNEWTEEQIEEFWKDNTNVCETINQIMALKQSCYLLRRTSYSCQSLSDSLYQLKLRLIIELKDKYNFDFDDEFVENYGFEK